MTSLFLTLALAIGLSETATQPESLADSGTTLPLPAKSVALRVAVAQLQVNGGRPLEELLLRVERQAIEARRSGAALLVLPELFTYDLVSPGAPDREARQWEQIARDATLKVFDHVASLSQRLGLAILGGTSPRWVEGELRNTALLALSDGRRFLQDKLFLTPSEVAWGWKPGTELKVVQAPWGRTVILTCYDSEFATLSQRLGPLAPELLLVPSMTGLQGFERVRWTSQARAVEHHAYVIVSGTVDGGRLYRGQAAVLTPRETGFPGVLAEGPLDREALVVAELDLARLRSSRAATGIYPARDEVRRAEPIEVILQE